MTTEEKQGVCPHCEQPGIAGQVCVEQLCTKKGYHIIPNEYFDVLDGKNWDASIGLSVRDFVIVKLLGVGGFGRVYLAYEPTMKLKSAIKFLDFSGLPKSLEHDAREKFALETRALAQLQHPNILRLMHFGSFQDRPYLLTEYIEGGVDLEDEIENRIARGISFTAAELNGLFRQLLDGLEAAHNKNIIHRDIKPANLMIQDAPGYSNFLRILDFGLAKFLDFGNETVGTSGTPDYMSPEQLTRQSLGPWTDLYAVGTIVYELISGRKPFASENIQEQFLKKVDPNYDPLTGIVDMEFPTGVTDFLRRGLASDYRKRYQNVDAFRSGLNKALKEIEDPANDSLSSTSLSELSTQSRATQNMNSEQQRTSQGQPKVGESHDGALRKWLEREEVRLFDDKK